MTSGFPHRRTLVAASTMMLTATLGACSGAGQPPEAPPASATVHVAPEASPADLARVEPGEEYAPFLAWRDRDTLAVTTLGSSTPTCWPRVESSALEQDDVLRLDLGYDREAEARGCNADFGRQGWTVPVPEGLGPEGVIRLVWDIDPGTVYEYPMGDSRPR